MEQRGYHQKQPLSAEEVKLEDDILKVKEELRVARQETASQCTCTLASCWGGVLFFAFASFLFSMVAIFTHVWLDESYHGYSDDAYYARRQTTNTSTKLMERTRNTFHAAQCETVSTTTYYTRSLWEDCDYRTACDSRLCSDLLTLCDKQSSLIQAARAFAILPLFPPAVIFAIFLMTALCRGFAALPFWVLTVVNLSAAALALVGAILGLQLYTKKLCDREPDIVAAKHIGPSVPLQFTAAASSFIGACVAVGIVCGQDELERHVNDQRRHEHDLKDRMDLLVQQRADARRNRIEETRAKAPVLGMVVDEQTNEANTHQREARRRQRQEGELPVAIAVETVAVQPNVANNDDDEEPVVGVLVA